MKEAELFNDDCLTITIDGVFLMRADKESCRVIFKNLAGHNFEEPRPVWQQQTHKDYIAMMESHFDISLFGKAVNLINGRGELLAEATIQKDNQGVSA